MKEKILQKALELFLQFGTREISNVKLVEVLGISTKTLYKYFENKEGLLEQVLYLYHDQQYRCLNSLSLDKNGACRFFDAWHYALEIAYNINQKFFEDLHHYYPELTRKVETAIDQKFTEKFLNIIQNAITDGSFEKDIKPMVVLDTVFLLHATIVRTEKFKKYQLSSFDIFLNTMFIYIRGLCSEEGISMLQEHIHSSGYSLTVKQKHL
ncbi:TetR/AcrR family transcriptional regulator [Pedobacter sp. MC2016-05]|uniref:TetR/AcrR family transcriptional regulator n=1 Tax=Pedobacter sp. MC2016-05 TaxID=2994474 RepID=UPI002247D22C|nr:TetR/AcrR family transcriptional regulator [Pedobacter sp. MC2016-05]MCX2475373.1 TetR/AcrR family transcriptional regulator [Pedobacter sp. MC2016-05]